jgi:preprotein translocase subunit YajC
VHRKGFTKLGLAVAALSAVLLSGGCLPTTTTTGDAGTGGLASSIWPMLIFIVVLFGLMYFVLIRPQRKRQREHQEMLTDLGRGVKVITAGGIYGQIESVSDDSFVLKIDSGATIRIAKSSVITRQHEPEVEIQ